MAGIGSIGNHGYIQGPKHDGTVARTESHPTAPIGDQVNLHSTHETGAAQTLRPTFNVTEQPVFSAEWAKNNLNGPGGDLSAGFKGVSGEYIGGTSQSSPLINPKTMLLDEPVFFADGSHTTSMSTPNWSAPTAARPFASEDGWNLST